tara:strand:+ start:927 stop:1652 length:726 start_codon:yes stop_codon:yes gene_type:complete
MGKVKNKSIDLYGDGKCTVDYVQHTGSDLTIVNSARVSFGVQKKSLDAKDRKLIRYLIKHKHTSTLEHNFITFRFKVPLFIRSQHHRHRTWSYNEKSARYSPVAMEFYEPESFRTQHATNRQASNNDNINPDIEWSDATHQGLKADEVVKNHHEYCHKLYEDMMEAGICREQARGVLPQNMLTEYYGSCNLSNLLKFIDLRTHDGAQWEIQQVAKACLRIAEDLYPETIKAYREVRGISGK